MPKAKSAATPAHQPKEPVPVHAATPAHQPEALPGARSHTGSSTESALTGAYGYTGFNWDSNAAQTSPPVKSPTWPNEPNGRSVHEDVPEKGVDVQGNRAEEGKLELALSSDSMTWNSPVKISAPVTRLCPRAPQGLYRQSKRNSPRTPACLCILE